MPPSRNAETFQTARPSVPGVLSQTSYWSPTMSFRQSDTPALDPNAGIVVGGVPSVAGLAPSAAVCR